MAQAISPEVQQLILQLAAKDPQAAAQMMAAAGMQPPSVAPPMGTAPGPAAPSAAPAAVSPSLVGAQARLASGVPVNHGGEGTTMAMAPNGGPAPSAPTQLPDLGAMAAGIGQVSQAFQPPPGAPQPPGVPSVQRGQFNPQAIALMQALMQAQQQPAGNMSLGRMVTGG